MFLEGEKGKGMEAHGRGDFAWRQRQVAVEQRGRSSGAMQPLHGIVCAPEASTFRIRLVNE